MSSVTANVMWKCLCRLLNEVILLTIVSTRDGTLHAKAFEVCNIPHKAEGKRMSDARYMGKQASERGEQADECSASAISSDKEAADAIPCVVSHS